MRPYSRPRESSEERFHIEEQTRKEQAKEIESSRMRFDRILSDIAEEDDQVDPDTEEFEQLKLYDKYLPQIDRAVLRQGLEKLQQTLSEKDSAELPDTVVFPDTAARPLFYAVKPLFDQLYKEKGAPTPEYRFLATWRDYGEEALTKAGLDEDYEEEKEEADRKIGEAMRELEGPVKERIDEILDEVGDRGHVLIVDDYTAKGSTLKQLNRLFGESAERLGEQAPTADFFTFFGGKNVAEKVDDNDKPYFQSITAGVTSEQVFMFLGFDYRARSDSLFPQDWELEMFARAKAKKIGVEKKPGEKYVQNVKQENKDKLRNLRRALEHEAQQSLKWIEKEKRRQEDDSETGD